MDRQPARSFAPNSFEQFVFDNAQQKVKELTETPTAASPILSEGNIGYISGKIYFVIGGVLKQFSVTDTP